jgi:sugar phosphate isomerase/epimerase
MKIGVITDCFQLPLEESLALAGKLGFDGVQIYATTGEFSPQTLTPERKAQIKKFLRENGLQISALCGDMGGYGYQIEADNPERIEKTKAIIDLAAEFGVSVVTTHIGVIPSDRNHPRYQTMLKALKACGSYAADKQVTLAIETGPETADTLLMFVKDAGAGVGVNLDPANFVMVTDQDPVEAAAKLGPYIVHTHAKDGTRKGEVPLGQGSVDWVRYLNALEDIGYRGFLTIEREVGPTPEQDIQIAVDFLRKTMKEN